MFPVPFEVSANSFAHIHRGLVSKVCFRAGTVSGCGANVTGLHWEFFDLRLNTYSVSDYTNQRVESDGVLAAQVVDF